MMHLILRMGMGDKGVTTREVMGAFNLKYKAAYWHLTTYKDKGLMRLEIIGEQKVYLTTDEGRATYYELIDDAPTVAETAEVKNNLQLVPKIHWTPKHDELLKTDIEEAAQFVTDKLELFAKLVIFSAIAFQDTSYVLKFKEAQ